MPLLTNFNTDPYYDDFNDNKNYYRLLFKPGNAVQARELTQLQSTLQDQIKKFGDHIFKTGSVVTGGQITIQNTAYLNVSSTYFGKDIVYTNFDKQVIINTANTKRAYVLKSYGAEPTLNEPITFIINQLYGDSFVDGETIYTSNTDPTVATFYANLASTNVTGNCQAFSVNEGVFYYDGLFIKSQPQSVAVNKYDRTGNAIVGFEVSESLIDYTEDTSLLDPAQGSSNFQAPGADRYKVSLVLNTRPIDSSDLTQFIELGTMEEGNPKNIVQTPIYAAIGDEFARRTLDESGDYIVKSFNLELTDSTANNAFANISLGSGKAYVKGYEFQTSAPIILTVPKPRTTETITNKRVDVDYGYYLFANSMFGNFATNQYGNVEFSIYNSGESFPLVLSSLATINRSNISNSVVATGRIKLQSFYSVSSNTLDSNNYIYKLYVTSLNSTPLVGNTRAGCTTTTIRLPSLFPSNTSIYKGMSIKLIDGVPQGAGSAEDNLTKLIVSSSSQDVTIQSTTAGGKVFRDATVTAMNNGLVRFQIIGGLIHAESVIVRNTSGAIVASANISPLSKIEQIGTTDESLKNNRMFQPAYIAESGKEPLLIRIGEAFVADNTIRDFSFAYRKLFQSVSFVSGVSQPLSLGIGETIQDATTIDSKQRYYQIVVTNPGSGSHHAFGKTIPAQQFSVDTSSRTISVDAGENMTANIYAVVSSSIPTSKTKTFVKANTILVDPTSARKPYKVFSGNTSAFVSPFDCQTIIDESFVQRRPGTPQHLYVTDVYTINAVFDFDGTAITTANYNSGNYSNVTSRYSLDTGQRDSYYDWSAIVLKPGQNPPRGPLLIRYDRFTSNGSGYFDVDSYTRGGRHEDGGTGFDYGNIPNYRSQDGKSRNLRDYLDFRPVRVDGANAVVTNVTSDYLANNFVLSVNEAVLGPQIAEPGLDIFMDYEYYLPRIDRVVLNKSREFQVLQGVPASKPVVPEEPADSMTLYVLTYPAYLTFTSSTLIQTYNHRRYTMQDIGRLDKRIQNLELYTSLSFAELAILSKNDRNVRDSNGISRPKNGVLVDSFTNKKVADIISPDFDAAIDTISRLCRGSYNIASTLIQSSPAENSGVEINGPLLMLASTETTFIMQNRASKTMNINPFNIVNFLGTVRLDPTSDVWKSETRLEAQNIDLSGGEAARDAWSSIQSTTWGAWDTTWTTTSKVLDTKTTRDVVNVNGGWASGALEANFEATGGRSVVGGYGIAATGDVITTTTQRTLETSSLEATRTGILSQIVPQELTQSMGDRLVDISVVQFMREKRVLVLAEKFKPFTTLNAFFDNVNVNDRIAKVNRFEMTQNDLSYKTTISDAETVTFYALEPTTVAGTDTFTEADGTIYKFSKKIGVGGAILQGGKNVFIANMDPDAAAGSWSQYATHGIAVKGDRSGELERTLKWTHQVGVALGGGASTITLAFSAGGAVNTDPAASSYIVGKQIRILRGKGEGQVATISGYDASTRVVTITGSWGTAPDTTSVYTIGTLETTEEGLTAGVFFIPADIFRTGEKIFRLIDDEFNNVENSRSNGDTKFYSEGRVNTVQEQTITVFVPTVTRSTVTEEFSATTSSVKTATSSTRQNNVVIGYYDPLAQTFLINPNQYPQGVVIDSVRVCFKTKDSTIPVTCQLRPVVNGYPSSAVVYPFAEKTLTPDKVTITDIPDLTDSSKYTEFKFETPVLLLPGEHSFVLVSNSNGYETYIAEIGATDIRTQNKISEQPYTGSLFLSQNGSTWTADQTSDIMFSIQKRVFSSAQGYANFNVDLSPYSANTPFDLLQLMSTDAAILNTTVTYDFISEPELGEPHPPLRIVPNFDYECVDGYGRRILNTVSGNDTFKLIASLSSSNPDISPMIDVTRLNLLTIENKINNMPLQNTGFVITNGGSGYTGNATVTFSYPSTTPAGAQGEGAAAVGIYEAASGKIIRIEITNPGTGYILSPTITMNAPATGGSITATAEYNGEDSSVGGNSAIRYITKRVKLAPGFDAGDLRVYMDAYRPPGAGILVYYKLLSETDPSNFDDNDYLLMTELSETQNLFSKNPADFFEAVFAPGRYGSGTADNRISYLKKDGNIADDFILFSIKVVMYGTTPVDVPKFAQLRVIALPMSEGAQTTTQQD